ncbi:MAG: cytochrome c family protein [Methyloceanibacter sp.]|nr:cytochrome c family protein [Methyloceanibacter sp.]
MKYYFYNKVAMAVLLALLLFFGTRTLIDVLYEEKLPATPGYEVAGAEEDLVHGGAEKKEEDKGAAFILAMNKADPAKGEQGVALCKACHSFEKGGPNMIGPGLYGILGKKIGDHEGYTYSAALKDHGGEWTLEDMNLWLENPQAYAAGTTMAYAGLPNVQDRANIIAYMNQNSDDPLPIPEPAEAPAAEEAADAGAPEESPDEAAPEILSLLAEADPAKGEKDAALCKVCHSFNAGGPTMVGPNLHNIVGAELAKKEGFSYSQALKDKGGAWTYQRLDEWLQNPQAFAAGTTMAYPGIADAKKRADVIAYMRSETENPPPLPVGDAVAAPAEEEAKSENADDPGEAAEDSAPAEEAAPAEDAAPAAETAPAQETKPAEPAATEAADSETVVNSPKVSEDAPKAPHKGEPPSPNQPQPVFPSETSSTMPQADEPGTAESGDGQSSWPQPVYPDGKPDGVE